MIISLTTRGIYQHPYTSICPPFTSAGEESGDRVFNRRFLLSNPHAICMKLNGKSVYNFFMYPPSGDHQYVEMQKEGMVPPFPFHKIGFLYPLLLFNKN